jgi:hydroxymethylbilane synthase
VSRVLKLATRGSEQALAQTGWLASAIEASTGVPVELVRITTTGDVRREVPIHELGGRGVFVKEVQAAVLDGRADLAVHSAKDLPSSFGADGLVLACVPQRRDPRDGVVGEA